MNQHLILIQQNFTISAIENQIYKSNTKLLKFPHKINFLKRIKNKFLASDKNLIKIFDEEKKIFFTYNSSFEILDLKVKSGNILFCTVKGAFFIEGNLVSRIRNSECIRKVCFFEGIDFVIKSLKCLDNQNVVENNKKDNLENENNLENEDNLENENNIESNKKDNIENKNNLIDSIVFATEDSIILKNLELKLCKIKNIFSNQKLLIISMENGFLTLSADEMKFYEIMNVDNFYIPENECDSNNLNSIITYGKNKIFFDENNSIELDDKILTITKNIIYLENGKKYFLENKKIFEKKENDFNWIFENNPIIYSLKKEFEYEEKKSIKYKKPPMEIIKLKNNKFQRNSLIKIKNYLRMHEYKKFINFVLKDKNIKNEIIPIFLEKVFFMENMKVKKNLMRKDFFEFMSDEDFVKIMQICKLKEGKKRLKGIIKNKKKMIESVCLIDIMLKK